MSLAYGPIRTPPGGSRPACIPQIRGSWRLPGDQAMVVTEYLPGGDLSQYVINGINWHQGWAAGNVHYPISNIHECLNADAVPDKASPCNAHSCSALSLSATRAPLCCACFGEAHYSSTSSVSYRHCCLEPAEARPAFYVHLLITLKLLSVHTDRKTDLRKQTKLFRRSPPERVCAGI
jgi:hypothetical protein